MAIGFKTIEGDLVINPSGSLQQITGKEKCARDFGKMMLTASVDSSITVVDGYYRYNSSYGVTLYNSAALAQLKSGQILDSVNLIIRRAVSYYVSVQDSRDDQSVGEVIIKVDFNPYFKANDRTVICCDISITTADGSMNLGTYSQTIA